MDIRSILEKLFAGQTIEGEEAYKFITSRTYLDLGDQVVLKWDVKTNPPTPYIHLTPRD